MPISGVGTMSTLRCPARLSAFGYTLDLIGCVALRLCPKWYTIESLGSSRGSTPWSDFVLPQALWVFFFAPFPWSLANDSRVGHIGFSHGCSRNQIVQSRCEAASVSWWPGSQHHAVIITTTLTGRAVPADRAGIMADMGGSQRLHRDPECSLIDDPTFLPMKLPTLPFIVLTDERKPDPETRKLIRSHVMRGKNRVKPHRRRQVVLHIKSPKVDSEIATDSLRPPSISRLLCSKLSAISLADSVDPVCLEDILTCEWL